MDTPIQVQLCCGLQALILWDSKDGPKPLIGCYFSPSYGWIPISWTKDGKYHFAKEKQDYYCNLDLEWVKKEPLNQ